MSSPDVEPERQQRARSERRFYGWFSVIVLGLFFGVAALVNSGWLAVFFDPE